MSLCVLSFPDGIYLLCTFAVVAISLGGYFYLTNETTVVDVIETEWHKNKETGSQEYKIKRLKHILLSRTCWYDD